MSTLITPTAGEFVYPSSDGKPMAENMTQGYWINFFRFQFESRHLGDPNVLVAVDVFWYPLFENATVRLAPDVMVVYGRPNTPLRSSYIQCQEENVAPQIVIEIRSPSNSDSEMIEKFHFYDQYGVEEYYIYDPDRESFQVWYRHGMSLRRVHSERGEWVSPRSGLRFVFVDGELTMYHPNGRLCTAPPQAFGALLEKEQQAEELQERFDQEVTARLAAQQRAEQEAAARLAAQQRADEEAAARLAEQQRADEATRRTAELEALVRALQAQLNPQPPQS